MKTFYDIHVHAMNLSHPNLTAYLFREDLISGLIDNNLNCKARFFLFLASCLPKSFIKKGVELFLTSGKPSPKDIVANCLSFFEIPLEYQFLVLEYFLKAGEPRILNDKNQIEIDGKSYDKLLLCPLVIDFGYKNIANSIFYNLTPKRPITNQVGDLLYAIRTYYRFNLHIKDHKMHLSPEIPDYQALKHEKLFEIYPFMGLDTRNYSLKDVQNMMTKYFCNFSNTETGATRKQRLFEKMGKADSNMYRNDAEYADVFTGIKVYPQLGFDPYPDHNADELAKVRYLYQFCVEKRIPIISHCSDAGFKVGEFDLLTSPEGKWKQVLAEYPELSLNFAHFGSESKSSKRQWRNAIIALSKEYPNVYTDISCNDAKPDYYEELEDLFHPDLNKKRENAPLIPNDELYQKVLYGSDFSINLLASKVNSYNEYLKAFADAKVSYKEDMCENNPARFLFGK
jgi:hypothetical protein